MALPMPSALARASSVSSIITKKAGNRTRTLARKALELFPNVNFSDPRVRWADISGDGLQDVVLIHNRTVEYWPSLGHGDWGACVRMEYAPRFPLSFDPRRLLVGDVDGDGLADLV